MHCDGSDNLYVLLKGKKKLRIFSPSQEQADLKISECPIFVRYTEYSMSKGQDFQVGVMTAFHFLWKLIFK